jgi:hypothetical protein
MSSSPAARSTVATPQPITPAVNQKFTHPASLVAEYDGHYTKWRITASRFARPVKLGRPRLVRLCSCVQPEFPKVQPLASEKRTDRNCFHSFGCSMRKAPNSGEGSLGLQTAAQAWGAEIGGSLGAINPPLQDCSYRISILARSVRANA